MQTLDNRLKQQPFWRRLSRADRISAGNGFQQQLAALFAWPENTAFPRAALDLLGEGGSPGNAFWLHADPVCMQADIDHAILFDAQSLQLNEDEADQLIAELNAHFSQDGIRLQRGSVANWYLAIDANMDFSTRALHDVIGRNVNPFMPAGSDARHWKGFMNEAQMLLHASEVNLRRETRGHLPVNSLWLWGEGRLNEVAHARPGFDRVLANNACARGLARQHGMECEALPADFSAFRNSFADYENVCLVLDDLFSSMSYADVAIWQEKTIELVETWLEPVLHYAANNAITIEFYTCNGSAYRLNASDRMRFWRRGGIENHLRLDE